MDLKNLYPKEMVKDYFTEFAGEVLGNLKWTEGIYEATLTHCANILEIEEWIKNEGEAMNKEESAPDNIYDEMMLYFQHRWPCLGYPDA